VVVVSVVPLSASRTNVVQISIGIISTKQGITFLFASSSVLPILILAVGCSRVP
jgi:hypothetical protein